FYKSQWKVIKKLFKSKRVLLIEKTGFGKSLCYQFPATVFPGVTVVLSPLISLMRDQVQQLNDLNIPSNLIYGGQTTDEKDEILFAAMAGQYKLLFISPERQANYQWIEAVRDIDISMVVIDEAHCISEWGHDFRPAYQKIVNTVKSFPKTFPILATTATATDHVIRDIRSQIGRSTLMRGHLDRPNFHLSVIRIRNDTAKYSYLKQHLSNFEGQGLLYCQTRVDAECYAMFLKGLGCNAVSYHGGYDNQKRMTIEKGFMEDRYQIVCSTNALGMGINKKNIRFVIHTHFPGSLLDYYQEIGRAGRDGQKAHIVLLYNSKDDRPIRKGIENNLPTKESYLSVIEQVKLRSQSFDDLLLNTGLSNSLLKIVLSNMEKLKWMDSIYESGDLKYRHLKSSDKIPLSHHKKLKDYRLGELEVMHDYCRKAECRVRYIRNHLKDRTIKFCGRCDLCKGLKNFYIPEKEIRDYVDRFWDAFHPELSLLSADEVLTPMDKRKNRLTNGVACSYYGNTEVGQLIRRSKYQKGGDFPAALIHKAVQAFQSYFNQLSFDMILYVPPSESGDLLRNFAVSVSERLNIPIHHGLTMKGPSISQKNPQNILTKQENVKGGFQFEPQKELKDKRILLIDDICDSGATIREISLYLSTSGAMEIAPLVIAKTVGSKDF
ncbi:MAG TPA: RecQ family ATP-dependent DNA helicase, partial [Spirochaetes bacterium]|nr:RecQ family ATP-dependent DNA helicase [Spirochaetota bacterium]